jgi:hypothetical protein
MAEQSKGPSPFGELTTAMTGASVDHDSPVGPPADVVIRTGHEADTFGVKSILMVPVAVAVMAGLAYVVVSFTFKPVNRHPDVPHSVAGEAAKKANERILHISSSDPDAKDKQPRLEAFRVTDSTRNGKTDPEFLRSVRFSENGNSPEYYPEDLRADNFIDPATKQKVLRDYAWVIDKKVARIPVAVAMELLVSEKLLPVREKESKPVTGTVTVPKQSNGGWGLPAEKTEPEKKTDTKKDDHK